MQNGHYTVGDIEGLTSTPADKENHTIQTAYDRVDGIISNGFEKDIL